MIDISLKTAPWSASQTWLCRPRPVASLQANDTHSVLLILEKIQVVCLTSLDILGHTDTLP